MYGRFYECKVVKKVLSKQVCRYMRLRYSTQTIIFLCNIDRTQITSLACLFWAIIYRLRFHREIIGLSSDDQYVDVMYLSTQKITKNKKHSENADTSTSLTLTCDLDLTSRLRKLMSLDVAYCIVHWYQVCI